MRLHQLALVVALGYLGSSTTTAFSPRSLLVLKNAERQQSSSSSLRVVEPKLEPPKTNEVQSGSTTNNESDDFDFSDPLRPVVFGEKLAIPFLSGPIKVNDELTNNGMYSWMMPYLNIIGFKAGNSVVGAMPTAASSNNKLTEEEKETLRQKAAQEMTNISMDERNRRQEMSYTCYKATALYAGISACVLDDGSSSLVGHFYRLAIFLPLAAAYGLQLSAKRGL